MCWSLCRRARLSSFGEVVGICGNLFGLLGLSGKGSGSSGGDCVFVCLLGCGLSGDVGVDDDVVVGDNCVDSGGVPGDVLGSGVADGRV